VDEDQQPPYEPPSVEEIETDGGAISTAPMLTVGAEG